MGFLQCHCYIMKCFVNWLRIRICRQLIIKLPTSKITCLLDLNVLMDDKLSSVSRAYWSVNLRINGQMFPNSSKDDAKTSLRKQGKINCLIYSMKLYHKI